MILVLMVQYHYTCLFLSGISVVICVDFFVCIVLYCLGAAIQSGEGALLLWLLLWSLFMVIIIVTCFIVCSVWGGSPFIVVFMFISSVTIIMIMYIIITSIMCCVVCSVCGPQTPTPNI